MKKLILFLFLLSGQAVTAQTNKEVKEIAGEAIAAGNGININTVGTTKTLSVSDNTSEQKVRVLNAGSIVGIRRAINLIAGTNVSFTMADNNVSDRVDVTINATGGGSSAWGSITGTLSSQTDLQTALNGKQNSFTSQTANQFFAAPDGLAGVPGFRSIVAADIPTLNQNTTGSAATLTTSRNIYGGAFNGSADVTGIIASTFGGTGNGFTKFSGPTTTEKIFTLPNASATILTDNAAVTIAQGGTGATTQSAAMNALLPAKTGNALKVLRVNAGETDYELATLTGGGSTNLTNTPAASTVTINSSSGTGTTLSGATSSQAGVMTAANRVKLDSAYTHRVALNDSVTRYYRADGSVAYDDTAKAFAFTGSLTSSGSNAQLVNDNASPGGNFHYGTNSGGTKGFFADAAVAATGKTLTINNSITLQGTDATTMTFPSTSATLARTDAAQTFTGVQLNQLTAGEQGMIPAIQFAVLNADFTLSAAAGAQNCFSTDRDTWTLEAGQTYLVEGNYVMTTGTTTTKTTAIGFGGTATMTAAALNVTGWNAVPGTVATAQGTVQMTALTSTVITATATTAGVGIYFQGIITVNAGGTFIPQINFSANPGGTNLMKRGSYIKITRIGSTTIQGAVN